MAVFVISVSGAQGTGKTTLARALGQHLGGVVVSRDPLMGALKDAGYPTDAPQHMQRVAIAGYQLQTALTAQLLGQGYSVVLECIAPPVVRDAWNKLADEHAAQFVKVDTVVSDRDLHRARLEEREASGKGGWRHIDWSEVEATLAALGSPAEDAVVADAVSSIEDNVRLVAANLGGGGSST